MATYSDLPKHCAYTDDHTLLYTCPDDRNAGYGIRQGDHILIDIRTALSFGDLAIARTPAGTLYVYQYGSGLVVYPGGGAMLSPDLLYGRVKGVLRLFEERHGARLQGN